MATTIETRYTYYSRSNTTNPAMSYGAGATFYSDARGMLTISYELNSTKTAYILYVAHKIQYYNSSENYCYINGTSISSKIRVGSGSWVNLGSYSRTFNGTIATNTSNVYTYGTKSYTIPLNADGTCTFSLQCIFNATNIDYIGDDQYYYKGGAQRTWIKTTYSLPKVNVSSTVSSDATSSAGKKFGEVVTFNIARPNDTITHTLSYIVGGTTYTIGSGIATSKTYEFPLSLVDSYPNNSNVTILVTCASSNGTSSSTAIYLTVPDTYVPTCSLAVEDVGSVPSDWNIWLRNISKIKGTITAQGSASSTIKSYASNANGENYNTAVFETSVIKNSGEQTITSTVKDSRERTASDNKTISVVDYFSPSISSFSVERCDENGKLDNEGTYGKIKCTYTIAPINNGTDNLNTKALIVRYGGVTKIFELDEYSGTFEPTDYFEGLSQASSHVFEFLIIDYFNSNGISYSFTMTPSFTTMSLYHGGKGISFGEIATEEGLHSHFDSYFHNKVYVENNESEYEELVQNSLEGDSTVAVPTVHAVNQALGSAGGSKYDTLWIGWFTATALSTFQSFTVADVNFSDYDFLLISVNIDQNKLNRTTLVILMEGSGVLCGSQGTIDFFDASYSARFRVRTDCINQITLYVDQLLNYSVSNVGITKVIGVKV